MIRVSLFTEEPVAAYWLKRVLHAQPGFRVVSVCNRWADLVRRLEDNPADILLVDSASELTLSRLRELQGTPLCGKIVLCVRTTCPETSPQALKRGLHGILLCSASPESVVNCLRAVSAGAVWGEDAAPAEVFATTAPGHLTERDRRVLDLLSQGMHDSEIAACLSLSEHSVKTLLTRLCAHLGLIDRIELVLYGLSIRTQPQKRPDFDSGSLLAMPFVPAVTMSRN